MQDLICFLKEKPKNATWSKPNLQTPTAAVKGCLDDKDCDKNEKCNEFNNQCVPRQCPMKIRNGIIATDTDAYDNLDTGTLICKRGFLVKNGNDRYADVKCVDFQWKLENDTDAECVPGKFKYLSYRIEIHDKEIYNI